MELLHDEGFDVVFGTNGDPEMDESFLGVTDFEDLISGSISAVGIERYKPARKLYRHAAERLEAAQSVMAHVSNG